MTAEETLQQVAHELEVGDMQSALKRFAQNEKNREVLTKLDESGRVRLATSLKKAQFVRQYGDNYGIYTVPVITDDGSIIQVEIVMSRLDSGEWTISNW